VIIFTEGSAGHDNEDVVLVRELPDHPSCWIGAIADGQGGRFGGAKAAQIACESIVNAACELPFQRLTSPGIWWDFFRTADSSVCADSQAGFTTMIAFCVLNGQVHGASCGDSAAYLYNAGLQLVELTAGQEKNPQIGSGRTSCRTFSSTLAKPWSLLATTDGVWKYVGRDKVTDLLKTTTGRDLASLLEASGRLPGSGKFPDDFSFALIEG
jgi:serine/threonine protein phosphatase PrpC